MTTIRPTNSNVLPPASMSCDLSPETIQTISDWADDINTDLKEYFRLTRYTSDRSSVAGIAVRIENLAGMPLPVDKENFLRDVVAFALNYSVPESDLYSMASDIDDYYDRDDEFLYALMTIVSLRVAYRLSEDNFDNGGARISDGFGKMARDVEQTIRSGDVTIEVGEASDQDADIKISGSGVPARYMSTLNEIQYQPTDAYLPFLTMLDRYTMMFNSIIHECVHIGQDKPGAEYTYLTSEEEANEIGQKAQILLERSFLPYFENGENSELRNELRDLEQFKVEANVEALRCMGYSRPMLTYEAHYWTEKEELMKEWLGALNGELQFGDDNSADQFYMQLIAARHLHGLEKQVADSVEERLRTMGADEVRDRMRSCEVRLNSARKRFATPSLPIAEEIEAAKDYLTDLCSMLAYSSGGDPAIHNEAAFEFFDVYREIGQVLLEEPRTFDGTSGPYFAPVSMPQLP